MTEVQIETLSELLGLSVSGLALDSATITSTGQVVTISSPARVLGRDGQLKVTVTAGRDGLVTTAEATVSRLSFADLAERGWLSADVALDRLPAVEFTDVELAPGPEPGQVRVTAPLPATALLGGSPFALAQPVLLIYLGLEGAEVNPLDATITARVGAGEGLGVSLLLPRFTRSWVLASDDGAQLALSTIETDLQQMSGADLSPLLPARLPGGFTVRGLWCDFDPAQAYVRAVRATIATTEPWEVIPPGILVLESAALSLRGDHYRVLSGEPGDWALSGMIVAQMRVLGVLTRVQADLGSSTLTMRAAPYLTFPGLGYAASELGRLMGAGPDFGAALPESIATLGSLLFEAIEVEVDLSEPTVTAASVTFSKPPDVDLNFGLLPGLTITDARFTIRADHPLADAVISGSAVVTGEIGEAEVALSVVRPTGGDVCEVSLRSSDGITLADLLGLVGLGQDAFAAALPDQLRVLSEFGLDALEVSYDLFEAARPRSASR